MELFRVPVCPCMLRGAVSSLLCCCFTLCCMLMIYFVLLAVFHSILREIGVGRIVYCVESPLCCSIFSCVPLCCSVGEMSCGRVCCLCVSVAEMKHTQYFRCVDCLSAVYPFHYLHFFTIFTSFHLHYDDLHSSFPFIYFSLYLFRFLTGSYATALLGITL